MSYSKTGGPRNASTDGTLNAMNKSRGSQSPGILKRNTSGSALGGPAASFSKSGMEPISEHEQMTQYSQFDDSVRDPGKSGAQQYHSGLTEFLKEEFYKRVGFYTDDNKELLIFWKTYVSNFHREQRAAAIKRKTTSFNELSDFDMDLGLGLPDYNSLMEGPAGANATGGRQFRSTQSPSRPFYPAPARSQKAPVTRENHQRGLNSKGTDAEIQKKKCGYKWELEGLYEKFGKCPEFDVLFTITNDLVREKDAHKMEQLQGENQRHSEEQLKFRNEHRRKIKDMLKLYYDSRMNDFCKVEHGKWIKSNSNQSLNNRDVNPYASKLGKGVQGTVVDKKKASATSLAKGKPSATSLSKDKRRPSESRESLSMSKSKDTMKQSLSKSSLKPAAVPSSKQKAADRQAAAAVKAELRRKHPELYADGSDSDDSDYSGGAASASKSGKSKAATSDYEEFEGGMNEKSISLKIKKAPERTYESIEWFKKRFPQKYAQMSRDQAIDKKSITALMFMIRDVSWDENKSYQDNIQNMTTHRQNDPYARKGEDGQPPQLQPYVSKILELYARNNQVMTYDIPGGRDKASLLIRKFFSDEELAYRLLLYRDYINHSKRRASVPLQILFDSIRPEDRLFNMIEQEPKWQKFKARDPTLVVKDLYGEPKENTGLTHVKVIQYITSYLDNKRDNEERNKQRREQDHYRQMAIDQRDVTKKCGWEWTPHSSQYTIPKDRWKVGKELKELAKQFPHDRVIQRMVTEEFKTNQKFREPEEYDIFNKAEEHSLKKNFTDGTIPEGLKWKVPDFSKEQIMIDEFRQRDVHQKKVDHATQWAQYQAEKDLEELVQSQALRYFGHIQERDKCQGQVKSECIVKDFRQKDGSIVQKMVKEEIAGVKKVPSLRSVIAKNYQELVTQFPRVPTDDNVQGWEWDELRDQVVKERFPHIAYGQDPKSKTFLNSYPLSFKNYFFKLFKSVIAGKKFSKLYPVSMVMAVGAKDGIDSTKNVKLKPFKVGSHLRKFNKRPPAWRSRAFKRQDPEIAKRLKNVFMMQSEIDNCTFEPNSGCLDPVNYLRAPPEAKAGEFFENIGDNFCRSNPDLFKSGKLKKAKILWLQGEFDKCYSTLRDGFDLQKIFMHFRPNEYKIWKDFKGLSKQPSRQQAPPQKVKSPTSGKGPKALGEKGYAQNISRGATPLEVDEKFELSDKQVEDIYQTFMKFDKKNLGFISFNEISSAMRELGYMPNQIELNDQIRDIEKKPVPLSSEDAKKGLKAKKKRTNCDLESFKGIMSKKMSDKASDPELREAFRLLDEDGSGAIDANEFRFVMNSISSGFSEEDIEQMINEADIDGDGSIDEEEFIKVMKSKKSQGFQGQVLEDMKKELRKFLADRKTEKLYLKLGSHFKRALDFLDDQYKILKKDFKERAQVYNEEFDSPKFKGMYDQVWALFDLILNRDRDLERDKKKLKRQQHGLYEAKRLLKEQHDDPLAMEGEEDDPDAEIDYRKIYKTIMCPLGDACPHVNKLRWPSTAIKSNTKFGKNCPYAHHPMELQFPETLDIRISSNKTIMKKKLVGKKPEFRYGGGLAWCTGCGANCNMCAYNALSLAVSEKLALSMNSKHIDPLKVHDRKVETRDNDNKFKKKFGILKKASVLFFYGRPNDAFSEVAKAIEIIKAQKTLQKEKDMEYQKYWQNKLNLPEGMELPKEPEKITAEDVTDTFLASIDSGGGDLATLKLYIQKVCPQISNAYDKNTFLNNLVEELYFKCEDELNEKQTGIAKINKKVEELVNIAEQLEAYGSDPDQQMDILDNDGNPIKLKKQRKTMCHNVQMRKLYKDEGIEMATQNKYFVDTKIVRKNIQDPATGRSKATVCGKGKDCQFAHSAIELDLNMLPQKIKNLKAVVVVQDQDMKDDKPLEAWKPASKNFDVNDLPEYVKAKKGKDGDDEEDGKNKKRPNILARENVFKKPYNKD